MPWPQKLLDGQESIYHPITGTFDVDFSGYPFVTVSLVSAPAAARIRDDVMP